MSTADSLVDYLAPGRESGVRPTKVTFEQTRHLAAAPARTTPDAGKILRNIASETKRELV